jgi:hypothetical protein
MCFPCSVIKESFFQISGLYAEEQHYVVVKKMFLIVFLGEDLGKKPSPSCRLVTMVPV